MATDAPPGRRTPPPLEPGLKPPPGRNVVLVLVLVLLEEEDALPGRRPPGRNDAVTVRAGVVAVGAGVVLVGADVGVVVAGGVGVGAGPREHLTLEDFDANSA